MNIPVYVVMHKATEELMPARMGKNGRGWSFWMPGQSVNPPIDAAPRVFRTKQAAANAVSAWERGMWGFHEVRRRVTPWRTGDDVRPEVSFSETELRPEPHPDRRPGDLEVIEAELCLWRS